MDLPEFIRTHREVILETWEREVRQLPGAEGSTPVIRDAIPKLLEALAGASEGQPHALDEAETVGEEHALQRLAVGFDLRTVTSEYRLLRGCIARLWLEHGAAEQQIEQLRVLDHAIDGAIVEAVERYSRARERTLTAIDRISVAALEESDLGGFLRKLMTVFVESVPSVESVAILLRQSDDTLMVAAAVGLEAEVRGQFRVPIGEGFAGTIAARRTSLTLHDLGPNSPVKSAELRGLNLKVLHGEPMIAAGRVVGVAHIGSRRVSDFTHADRLLFSAMVSRATMAVAQAELRVREREATARAAQTEERLRLAAEAARIGTWDCDLKTAELHCDGTMKQLFGLPFDAVTTPDTMLACVHPDDREPLLAHCQAIVDAGKGSIRTQFRVVRANDGEERWVEVRGMVRTDENRTTVRCLGTSMDVTEPRRAREELERDAVFRERFIAILGHDLRNPLSAITFTATALVRSEEIPDGLARSLRRILASSDRATRMVGDLLDFARTRHESGIPVVRQPTRLESVVRNVVDEVLAANPAREVEVTTNGTCDGEWDPDRMAQVVSNLVGNAIRHSPPDARVRVSVEGHGEWGVFAVHNDGSAIPAERIATIFDPFKRAAAGAQASEGLGLGLYITQQIVAAHGGRIDVESDAAGGTTFTVRVPKRMPRR